MAVGIVVGVYSSHLKTSICISVIKPTRCTSLSSLFYFVVALYILSDGLSVHHQETKTVHTASGICQTDSADCLLAGTRWNSEFYLVPASKQSAEPV